MKIRRFYSKSMRNALKQVTDEFGNDAAILSSQKTPSGVEVIAALDYDAELLPESISSLAKRKDEVIDQLKHVVQSNQLASTKANNESNISHLKNRRINHQEERITQNSVKHAQSYNQVSSVDTNILPSLKSASLSQSDKVSEQHEGFSKYSNHIPETQFKKESLSSAPISEFNTKSKSANPIEWSTDPGLIAMKEEIGLMRSMMKEQLDGIGWERLTERDPVSAMLNRRLYSLGVSQQIIDQLIPRVNSKLDPECCWQNLLAILAKSIPTDQTNIISNGGVLAFMGGSGCGKTTTIAKLAARYVIKHGQDSVALITTDNYRAAGRNQLQNFAKILNLPVAQVTQKNTLEQLIEKFFNKKLILIDTPGMNRNDKDIVKHLGCLNNLSGAAGASDGSVIANRPIKKLLLLPATHQQSVLQQSLNLFKAYSPDSCIVTKLDEAASLGEILSLLIENQLPVSYTTNGQKVPENIRVARNHHLVSKAVWLSNKYKSQNKIIVSAERKMMKIAG